MSLNKSMKKCVKSVFANFIERIYALREEYCINQTEYDYNEKDQMYLY